MNAFLIYDLTFLVVFTLAVVIFLYTHKKNLQRQGLLYLYRTKIGIKFIDSFTEKYKKILKPLQYLILTSGYLLMAGMIYLLAKFSWVYLTSPVAAKALKVPVLIPLVPYLPDLFKLDFLPSFNFTYWIIIIAIIAIPHEFAHGIFARLHKIKVHSTGFGFLGPFLAAFVEPDEKQMAKAKKFPQLSILAAGTFANVIFTVIFGIILWIFFISAFAPSGLYFTSYSTSVLNISQIQIPSDFLNQDFVELSYQNQTYFASPSVLKQTLDSKLPLIVVYDDTPAFNVKLQGAITHIDGAPITSLSELTAAIQSHTPGDIISIRTAVQDNVRDNNIEFKDYTLKLGEREGNAFLGIGIAPIQQQSGLLGWVFNLITGIKDPMIYYESSLGALGWFIYYLLWWTVLICISVALVNMLPVGIFDGGRFFYLTVWSITGSEKIAKKAFAISTWLILALIAALMIKWVLIFI